MLGLSSLLCPA
ncbi:rCG44313, partial [Rattus norvegicus]